RWGDRAGKQRSDTVSNDIEANTRTADALSCEDPIACKCKVWDGITSSKSFLDRMEQMKLIGKSTTFATTMKHHASCSIRPADHCKYDSPSRFPEIAGGLWGRRIRRFQPREVSYSSHSCHHS